MQLYLKLSKGIRDMEIGTTVYAKSLIRDRDCGVQIQPGMAFIVLDTTQRKGCEYIKITLPSKCALTRNPTDFDPVHFFPTSQFTTQKP